MHGPFHYFIFSGLLALRQDAPSAICLLRLKNVAVCLASLHHSRYSFPSSRDSSVLLKILTGVFWPRAAQAVRHPVVRGIYPQHIVGFALDPR
jgi:hypothetical protein